MKNMKNLYSVNLRTYWTDFTVSSIIFAISFYFVCTAGSIVGFVLASIFLYRLCAFTHEIAHQSKNPKMKWFKRIWNLTGGLLMFQPSIRFTKPHLKHHTTGIFATKEDPQYPLIFSDVKLAAIIFFILPWFLPFYNIASVIFPKAKLIQNIMYKGIDFTEKEYTEMAAYGFYYLCALCIATFIASPLVFIAFYLVSVGAWCLSVLRIPLEHPLSKYKETSTAQDQKVLSETHESPIYIPVQPLALRYHKAHHMYPKVPYHNLADYHYELKRTDGYVPD